MEEYSPQTEAQAIAEREGLPNGEEPSKMAEAMTVFAESLHKAMIAARVLEGMKRSAACTEQRNKVGAADMAVVDAWHTVLQIGRTSAWQAAEQSNQGDTSK